MHFASYVPADLTAEVREASGQIDASIIPSPYALHQDCIDNIYSRAAN